MCDNKALYTAFKSKDARFDGKFFVGISSTGIYCRPVCKARQPKEENCTFYSTAAAAEQAGYRPCLLCRPELAPGTSIMDATSNLVYRAARMLEENCGSGQSIEEIADRLGCTDRHLRRVFAKEYNVSPVEYLQTCRLLLAKNLLTDTDLSVLEVAMASGFGSLRRFNDLFKKHYALTPTKLRKQTMEEKQSDVDITLELSYRPPYNWKQMLRFLEDHAIQGVEVIEDNEYARSVRVKTLEGKEQSGWIKIRRKENKHALLLTISESLLSLLPQVLVRVKHLFDLYCDPEIINENIKSMNEIKPNLYVNGTRVPGCFDSFEIVIDTILSQKTSKKAAKQFMQKFVETYGKPIKSKIEGLTYMFPIPEEVGSALRTLGIPNVQCKMIYDVIEKIRQKEIDFESCVDPQQEVEKLRSIENMDTMSAYYIGMRTMEWTDAFVVSEKIKSVLKSFTDREIIEIAEHWRPWRSYAMLTLQSL